jgi:hypothetical protein
MIPSVENHFVIHGQNVSLESSLPALGRELHWFLRTFTAAAPAGDSPARALSSQVVRGIIKPFDLSEISRSISAEAVIVPVADDLVELYCHGERYWLVDERWGMCEINLLKRQWRSWILPRTALDPIRCVEAAVLWPAAQLMRARGTELLPAISIERNGWGALILAPYGIAGELSRLIHAGYRVVGQRWSALVRRADGVDLLHMPGLIELPPRGAADTGEFECPKPGNQPGWIDLAARNPWAISEGAQCRAVFAIAPGRRSIALGRDTPAPAALGLLRRYWPMIDLPNHRRRLGEAASILAQKCGCVAVQLSRNPDDFLKLVDSKRRRTAAPQKQRAIKPKITLNPLLRKQLLERDPRIAIRGLSMRN